MVLLPIDIDETKNKAFYENPDCLPILEVYPDYYRKIGYCKPWIGYFVSLDGKLVIGAGGFKGAPKEGSVEIAYSTFKMYEGQGFGTKICSQLVLIALQQAPEIRITARTLPDAMASIAILKRNGFESEGTVIDDDDGAVLEWVYKKQSTS